MPIHKVLVVDDSRTEQMHLTDLLQKAGMSVRSASNAEDALRQVAVRALQHAARLPVLFYVRLPVLFNQHLAWHATRLFKYTRSASPSHAVTNPPESRPREPAMAWSASTRPAGLLG